MQKIAVVGLGYVGLPLAIKFAEHFPVIGFDVSEERIRDLKKKHDKNLEVSERAFERVSGNIEFTKDAGRIAEADFVVIGVPTPVTEDRKPDLSYLKSASEIVGRNLKKGAVVVYESTTYPGCTEEFCLPILERSSGLRLGEFFVGYSPERVNPGDREHTIDNVYKIVAGCSEDITERLAGIYGKITKVYKASSIKVAESAKVIENVQRDINIALFNELAMLFGDMCLDSKEVFDAAATKWNFLRFHPGFVGGHCIPVDPYYLAQKALDLGYTPELILAGRNVNESLAGYVAKKALTLLNKAGRSPKDSRVLVLGAAYKENVPDLRDSKVRDLVEGLEESGMDIHLYEPLIQKDVIFGVKNRKPSGRYDAVIYAVKHKEFSDMDMLDLLNRGGILMDVKRVFDGRDFEAKGFIYWGL